LQATVAILLLLVLRDRWKATQITIHLFSLLHCFLLRIQFTTEQSVDRQAVRNCWRPDSCWRMALPPAGSLRTGSAEFRPGPALQGVRHRFASIWHWPAITLRQTEALDALRRNRSTYLSYVGALWKIQGGHFGAASVSVLDNPLTLLPAHLRILNAVRIAWKYAALLIFPATLSCDYSYDQITLYANWQHLLLPLLGVLAVIAFWIWAYRNAIPSFCWPEQFTSPDLLQHPTSSSAPAPFSASG
jgi:hypothetical protein